MSKNTANATWQGNLTEGRGEVALGLGAFKGQFSFKSRFETGVGTNPEELIAAAHAACFSMAFSNTLAKAGFTPTSVATTAVVALGTIADAPAITNITLTCHANVPNISQAQFAELAEAAKTGCPISKALAAVPSIELVATLQQMAA